jgi:hypothetical protein
MSDKEYVAKMVVGFALVITAISLIWFICHDEPVSADVRMAESTMTSGNVTNAEQAQIEEAKKKRREEKIETVISLLEALSELAEALGDAD